MTDKLLGAIVPWFGSKRQLAPDIVAELGPHRGYCEPCCGSMAVLLGKPRASMEIVNDLHGDLINLARVLASPLWEPLCDRVERTLMAHPLHTESRGEIEKPGCVAESIALVGPEHVERAYWYLIYSWQGRNGVSGTSHHHQHLSRRFTTGGGHSAVRWRNVGDSLPWWADRLRGVTIDQMDMFELLAKLEDSEEWAIYVDPPYLLEGDEYLFNFKDSVPDPRDRERQISKHEALALALARFQRTRVIVSYYDHPSLDTLFGGWTKRQLEARKNLSSESRRDTGGVTKAPEVLFINGPSFAAKVPGTTKRLFV